MRDQCISSGLKSLFSVRARALTLLCLAFLIVTFSTVSYANAIVVTQASVYTSDELIQLDADFDIQFSSQLQEALTRGVALYFLLEVEVAIPRWYWVDSKPVNFQRTVKVTYSPLLQQYRVNANLITTTYANFVDMRRSLSRVRGVQVGEKSALKRDETYQAFIRYRLDTSQLPKPFQLSALASPEWKLTSEWTRVELRQ